MNKKCKHRTLYEDKAFIHTCLIIILIIYPGGALAWDWLNGGDHAGSEFHVAESTTIAGYHYNISTFTLAGGIELAIEAYGGTKYGSVTISAGTINVYGTINGNGSGYAGGNGGGAQVLSAAGGNTGAGGNPVLGAGVAGDVGTSSSTVSGSGAGGGGGGGYGGAGAGGGNGGQNSLTLAGGTGGAGGVSRGQLDEFIIDMGSGGAGAGGGGSGGPESTPGGAGGNGGAGGGCISLEAGYITITGTVTVEGIAGGTGGSGGGTATNGGGGGGGAGGGSGGGILVHAQHDLVITTTAVLNACGAAGGNGGSGGLQGGDSGILGGSGGGGRIKMFYSYSYEDGLVSAGGGSYFGSTGGTGTIFRKSFVSPSIQGIYPASDAYGVSVDTFIYISFNQEMEELVTETAISLAAVKDNGWNDVYIPVQGTAAYATSGDTCMLVFQPSGRLLYNYLYEVRLATSAKGVQDNNMSGEYSWRFRARMNPSEDNYIVTDDEAVRVVVSSGTMPAGTYITIADVDSSRYALADTKVAGDPAVERIGQVLEFLALEPSGDSASWAGSTVTVVFSYADADGNGLVDGYTSLDERCLAIYRLREDSNAWVLEPGSEVDTSNNTVSAGIAHFSVYTLVGHSISEVSGTYAYPVPYSPHDGVATTGTASGGIVFAKLPAECVIKIYSITGKLVKEITVTEPADGNHVNWDVLDSNGAEVTSGVYIYHVVSGVVTAKGKLMVIR